MIAVDAARRLVLTLWRQYDRKPHANCDMEMGTFFRWLETDHPETLRFRLHGSKWELVQRWLVHDDKVRRAIVRAGRL
jgi:hypothetical protein